MSPLDPALWVLVLPAVWSLVLAFLPDWRMAARVNTLGCASILAAALLLAAEGGGTPVDGLTLVFLVLTAFVGFTTSLFGAGHIGRESEAGRLRPVFLRLHHAAYQAFLFATMLALLADNPGVLWMAIGGAMLAIVLMIGLRRTPSAVDAAWTTLILCGTGLALALFGTVLVHLAVEPGLEGGAEALNWSVLMSGIGRGDSELLGIAFVFLLVGYGATAGLVPLHVWVPGAHAEGPAPVSAILSGLLSNVALYALLRFKMLMSGGGMALAPGPLLMGLGLLSLLLGAFALHRRRDLGRFFAFSAIGHTGIAAFAFGIGGPVASFAGLLHVVLHSLTKSAVLVAVGLAVQARGAQQSDGIGGVTAGDPVLGWSLLLGVVALAGLPPFGLFTSEFLIVSSAFDRQPILGVALGAGLLVALGALIARIQGIRFGDADGIPTGRSGLAVLPVYLHLALVLVGGLWLPAPLAEWLLMVAVQLG